MAAVGFMKNKRGLLFMLALIVLAGVFTAGWKIAKYSSMQEKLAAMNALIDEQESIQAQNAEIENGYYEDRDERRVKYKELYREARRQIKVSHDVSNCSIGFNGLQLWNAANKGEAPGKPKTAMP